MKNFILAFGFFGTFNVLSQNSFSILSPSQRLATYTATTYIPKFFFTVGSFNSEVGLNFSVGDFISQSSSNSLSNLVDSRAYLGARTETPIELISILKKTKKGGYTALGAQIKASLSINIDRDFLRIATAGLLPEGFGVEEIHSRGVDLNAHVFTETYIHQVRQLGKLNFGYRVRLINPIAGVQFITPNFSVTRVNSASENTLDLEYQFKASAYGVDLQSPVLPSLGVSSFFSKYSSFAFDIGAEQEINSKLKVGIALKGLPGSIKRGEVRTVLVDGGLSYSGVDYTVGVDSLNSVFNSLTAFDFDSILPDIVQIPDDVIKIPLRPEITIYLNRYLSEESVLFLSMAMRSNGFDQDFKTSAFVYSRSNKLFHLAYGVNWWANNNSFDATIAGRMLIGPYTRLSLGMSNPFSLPRIGPGGAVLVPEKFQGFMIGLGISFGRYRGEDF